MSQFSGSSSSNSSQSAQPITPNSTFTPLTVIFASFGQGAHMVKNATDQLLVQNKLWMPPLETRIGAFAATLKFSSGTVGSGTSSAIQSIHSIFGSFGSARIGNYFNQPVIQQFMARPISNQLANTYVASGEYRYWCKIMHVSYMRFTGDLKAAKLNFAALQNLIGGAAGASATVPMRAAIVQGFCGLGLRTQSISLCTGALGFNLMVFAVHKLYTYQEQLNAGDDGRARIEVLDD